MSSPPLTVEEVRPFPVSRLRTSINEALNTPDMAGKKVAIVATGSVDEVGAQFGLFVKIGNEWSFGGTLEHRMGKPLRKEVVVAWAR